MPNTRFLIPSMLLNAHRRYNEMISADLECLRLPHEKPHFTSNLMLQELDRPSTSLLPLISIFIETVKL
uniref:Uncharacterized protein n=1 Tax=Medicago truncatula TaxID=3880 RepID=I3SS43_MEDTR|nr:unknown [Medicago truncatula]AFK48441.1 unknown [Medicago truncatula]